MSAMTANGRAVVPTGFTLAATYNITSYLVATGFAVDIAASATHLILQERTGGPPSLATHLFNYDGTRYSGPIEQTENDIGEEPPDTITYDLTRGRYVVDRHPTTIGLNWRSLSGGEPLGTLKFSDYASSRTNFGLCFDNDGTLYRVDDDSVLHKYASLAWGDDYPIESADSSEEMLPKFSNSGVQGFAREEYGYAVNWDGRIMFAGGAGRGGKLWVYDGAGVEMTSINLPSPLNEVEYLQIAPFRGSLWATHLSGATTNLYRMDPTYSSIGGVLNYDPTGASPETTGGILRAS